jgi:hypothetical protein
MSSMSSSSTDVAAEELWAVARVRPGRARGVGSRSRAGRRARAPIAQRHRRGTIGCILGRICWCRDSQSVPHDAWERHARQLGTSGSRFAFNALCRIVHTSFGPSTAGRDTGRFTNDAHSQGARVDGGRWVVGKARPSISRVRVGAMLGSQPAWLVTVLLYSANDTLCGTWAVAGRRQLDNEDVASDCVAELRNKPQRTADSQILFAQAAAQAGRLDEALALLTSVTGRWPANSRGGAHRQPGARGGVVQVTLQGM